MSNLKQISDSEFSSTISTGLVLVDFWAPWCGPCKMLTPILADLASEYSGQATIVGLNVDENPDTPTDYALNSIPTILVFKDGTLKQKITGLKSKVMLKEIIEENLV